MWNKCPKPRLFGPNTSSNAWNKKVWIKKSLGERALWCHSAGFGFQDLAQVLKRHNQPISSMRNEAYHQTSYVCTHWYILLRQSYGLGCFWGMLGDYMIVTTNCHIHYHSLVLDGEQFSQPISFIYQVVIYMTCLHRIVEFSLDDCLKAFLLEGGA